MQPQKLYGYSSSVFMDVFPSYDDFKTTYADSPFFTDNEEWVGPAETTFRLIYNRYMGSHLAMSDEQFKAQFENILFEHYERFEYDIDVKKQARALTDEEWSEDGIVISNTAISPNDVGDTDSEEVDSLDQQNKTIAQANKSSVLYRKKDQNKAYSIKSFLDNFKYLFLRILDDQYTSVWVSDSDGNLI